jgi:hypothetical protein
MVGIMAAGGPKAHPTKWTLVFSTRVMRFDTLVEAEAELKKAQERGERAYIQPPIGTRLRQRWRRLAIAVVGVSLWAGGS